MPNHEVPGAPHFFGVAYPCGEPGGPKNPLNFAVIWAERELANMLGSAMRKHQLLLTLSVACTTAVQQRGPEPSTLNALAMGVSAADGAASAASSLEPGDVVELRAGPDGSASGVFATPGGDERFVLIVGSTKLELDQRLFDYSVTTEGTDSPMPQPTRLEGCSVRPRPRSALSETEPSPAGEAPSEGQTRSLSIPTSGGATTVTAKAISVGKHALVWADTTNPTNLDLSFASKFRDDFENVILPRAREVFGVEPDTDENGRIHLVFSRLTHDRAVAFFTACDLRPDLQGCTASNRGEYLYLTPPDAIAPPYNSPNAIKEILAHELSHLLHFNRKVMKNDLRLWPDSSYTAEGIGALSQDVTGYQAGNLYVTKAGLDGIDGFSLGDVFDPRARAGAPDGVLRGASYLFVRYLYDRGGGDEVSDVKVQDRGGGAFLRELLGSPRSVTAALPELAGGTASDIAMDFFTALAMSNREEAGGVAPSNGCFAFLPTLLDPVTQRQRGANLFASFHGQRMNGPRVGTVSAPDGKLRAGGVEYLELAAAAGVNELAVTVRVDPQALPRLRVGRWK
jgi:hypothetical protein